MKRLIGFAIVFVTGATIAAAETGKAAIRGTSPESTVSGSATLTETESGLTASIEVSNVPPGQHGLHVHQYGDCGDAGTAAGGHYNPHSVKHGFLPADGFEGAHAGDLGNIEVGPDGTGKLELILAGVRLSGGEHSVGGRAIILHEKPDDFGQPTGNAGGRIGCGIIRITGE